MSYTLQNIFDYTEDEMDTFLKNVGNNNSYSLNEKRYMVVYYLMVNNYLKNDKYTEDPKFSEYLKTSSTWKEFEKQYLDNKFLEFGQALENKDTNLARSILQNNPELISFKDKYEETVLMIACIYGNTEIVELLLDTGRSHPEYQNFDGKTPLMIALYYGNTEIAKLLLATGQSHPEYKDNRGMTALMLASMHGHTEIVKLLLATGQSHPEYQDNYGYTALINASDFGRTEIVELLLATGQSHPEYKNTFGETALMYASQKGSTEIVELLLATGQSHPEYQDNDGNTALMNASQLGRTEIVELLLATGQSHPELKNNNGKNALDLAIRNNHTEIIELLNPKYYEPILGNNPSVKLITDETRFKIGCNSNGIEDGEVIDPISLEKIPTNLLVVAVPILDNTKTTCFNGKDLWNWWIESAKSNPRKPADHPLSREEFDAESISSLKELLDKNIE
jgi:ankyrin repeat protein